MQNELSKSKESTSEIHCLRAQLQSLSSILGREVWLSYKLLFDLVLSAFSKFNILMAESYLLLQVGGLQSLSDKSAGQLSEIERLHMVV